uniref:Fe2OG dioxygenase domain-containing protein n=2 Tax=Vitis vinifera TaxID=29760 RepID=F6H0U0_VITVI
MAVERVQTIAFSSILVDTIPPEFIRSEKEQPALTTCLGCIPQVPTIDFSDPDEGNLTRLIAEASSEWAMFQIVNHGIPSEVITNLQKAGKEFFELPQEEKELYAKPPDSKSIEGYGSKLQKEVEGKKAWVDHLFHNIWPPSAINYQYWPKNPPSYRAVNEEYCKWVQPVGHRLLSLLSLGLGLEKNELKENVGGDELKYLLKINYYPPCPRPDLALGVVAHTDMSSITILVPNEVQGLQVFRDDHWFDVKYIPDALVIHIGDQLEILSNGKYKSVLHRTTVTKEITRMSWPVFLEPPSELAIGPLPKLINEKNPPKYQKKKYCDYRIRFYCVNLTLLQAVLFQPPTDIERVQAIAFSSLSEGTIPPEFIRSEKEEPAITTFHGYVPQVPTIDFSDPDEANLTRLIAVASMEWGIFQIVNHGIPFHVITSLQKVGREFFELSQEEKELYAKPPDSKSIEGYGTKLQKEVEGKKAWVDHLFHKVWPPSAINYHFWPKNPPSYRDANEEYTKCLRGVADRLFSRLSLGLGLDEDELKKSVGGDELTYLLKINYYPPCPRPDLALGVVAHTDMSSITMLVPNEVQGLQVFRDDHWFDVKYIPNALVIHIGDQLEILSNGKYRSVLHRATVNKEMTRMSWPVFLEPPPELAIGPLSKLINEENPPKYKEKKYCDYVYCKLNKIPQ